MGKVKNLIKGELLSHFGRICPDPYVWVFPPRIIVIIITIHDIFLNM